MRCKRIAVFGALVLVAACVPSLHPFYTAADLVRDPALSGTWWGDDEDSFTFEEDGEAYSMVHEIKGVKKEFEAHLFRLGDVLWLDLYPVTSNDPDLHDTHLIPVHTVSRVWLEEGALRLGMLSPDWLEEKLDAKTLSIAHERVGNAVVLTAPTAKLQKFLRVHADDAEAFVRRAKCAPSDGRRALCLETGVSK